MNLLTAVLALVSFAMGGIVLWANPRRNVNIAFSLLSVTLGIWLLGIYKTFTADVGLPWLKFSSGAGAFFAWNFWILKESILRSRLRFRLIFKSSLIWFSLGVTLAILCQTDLFIPSESTAEDRRFGVGYPIYFLILIVCYVAIAAQTFIARKRSDGIRRLELEFIILGGVGCAVAGVVMTSVSSILGIHALPRLSPLVVVGFLCIVGWAVSAKQIFEAGFILKVIAKMGVLTGVLSAGVWMGASLVPNDLGKLLFLVLFSLGFLAALRPLDNFISRLLNIGPRLDDREAQHEALIAARHETDLGGLIEAFERILSQWARTEHATILCSEQQVLALNARALDRSSDSVVALAAQGWISKESMTRDRKLQGNRTLTRFLDEQDAEILITSGNDRPPDLVIGLPSRPSKRPYTYPEVQVLQDLAGTMETAYISVVAFAQAKHAENLAMIGFIGAGLAHEIRNPLVAIKCFAQLLPQKYEDRYFREEFSQLIVKEVGRIEELTNRLLKLSRPKSKHFEKLDLVAAVRECFSLSRARASQNDIEIEVFTNESAIHILADAEELKQVILNLIINAIQALQDKEGERHITVKVLHSATGNVELAVIDNGPGVPDNLKEQIFKPFATDKAEGSGFGLAISAQILRDHKADFTVVDTPGGGATFLVKFAAAA